MTELHLSILRSKCQNAMTVLVPAYKAISPLARGIKAHSVSNESNLASRSWGADVANQVYPPSMDENSRKTNCLLLNSSHFASQFQGRMPHEQVPHGMTSVQGTT
eukprot:6212276-Pleurochrysis_carterae.AAC.4